MQGRPLELADAVRIKAALPSGVFVPSEYCFANLWLFREIHGYRLVENPVPHVRGTTYDGQVHALPLDELTGDLAAALLAGDVDCLYPYGENGPEEAERLGLAASDNPADSDYWYAAAELAELVGAKTRRQQMRAFSKAHSPEYVRWHDGLAEEALVVLDGWARDITRPAADTDVAECREAIALAEELGLEGGLVRVGNKPVAFLLASRAGTARILHFAKGRRAYDGCYPWLFATYAARCGGNWMNFEQDLGIDGLAQSKRAYAPHRIKSKYRLRKCLHI